MPALPHGAWLMRQLAHAATPHAASTYPYNALAASCRERDTTVAEYEIHVDEIRALGFLIGVHAYSVF